MKIICLLAAVGVLLFGVAAFGKKLDERPLKQMADRVERVEFLPEETRRELTHLIERVNRDPKITAADRQNVSDAARIERALQDKPTERLQTAVR